MDTTEKMKEIKEAYKNKTADSLSLFIKWAKLTGDFPTVKSERRFKQFVQS